MKGRGRKIIFFFFLLSFKSLANIYSADSDPHFVVHIPVNDLFICFDITGNQGEVYNLLTDEALGKTCWPKFVITSLLTGGPQLILCPAETLNLKNIHHYVYSSTKRLPVCKSLSQPKNVFVFFK